MQESAEGGSRRELARMRPLPAFLFNTDQPKLLYILKAWLLVFLPSIALGLIVSQFAGSSSGPQFGMRGPKLLFMVTVFAPVLETLIMVPPLLLFNRLFGPRVAVILSALGWAVAHGLAATIWGFVVWWPFLIMSIALLVWRAERGLLVAIGMVIAIHALQNGVAGVALLLL